MNEDLEKDGEITLFKGKPFTGVYPDDFDNMLVIDRSTTYYKENSDYIY